jgi:hypothetical protein
MLRAPAERAWVPRADAHVRHESCRDRSKMSSSAGSMRADVQRCWVPTLSVCHQQQTCAEPVRESNTSCGLQTTAVCLCVVLQGMMTAALGRGMLQQPALVKMVPGEAEPDAIELTQPPWSDCITLPLRASLTSCRQNRNSWAGVRDTYQALSCTVGSDYGMACCCRYRRYWQLAQPAHAVSITSFNEWGEGTQVRAQPDISCCCMDNRLCMTCCGLDQGLLLLL